MYFLEVSGISVTTDWQPNKKQSEHACKRQRFKKKNRQVVAFKELLFEFKELLVEDFDGLHQTNSKLI